MPIVVFGNVITFFAVVALKNGKVYVLFAEKSVLILKKLTTPNNPPISVAVCWEDVK